MQLTIVVWIWSGHPQSSCSRRYRTSGRLDDGMMKNRRLNYSNSILALIVRVICPVWRFCSINISYQDGEASFDVINTYAGLTLWENRADSGSDSSFPTILEAFMVKRLIGTDQLPNLNCIVMGLQIHSYTSWFAHSLIRATSMIFKDVWYKFRLDVALVAHGSFMG